MSLTSKTLLISLLFLMACAHDRPRHQCIHGQVQVEPEFIDVPHKVDFEGRVLQTYDNIRIYLDFSSFGTTTADVKNYIQNVLLPPVKNYWQKALQVIPVNGNLTAKGYTTMCNGGITVPSFYNTVGINADLVLFVTTTTDSTQSYVAYAGSCLSSSTNKRPIFGRIVFNLAKVAATTNKAYIENDMTVTFHEITHALGFSDGLFSSYIDPVTNVTLTGHVFNKVVNGLTVKVLNLPPLTSRIRSYFNCSTVPGAYLENEGGTGSANTHFERRIFYNEYMTGSTLEDFRITEFSLALLEGTGWYKVDYRTFKEFCSPLKAIGCSWTGRGAGACGASSIKTNVNLSSYMDYWNNKTVVSDLFADNCPAYDIYTNLDCENDLNQNQSTLPSQESYGFGSKCFIGTLYKPGYSLAPNGYCFKYNCELQTNGSYIIRVNVGNVTANCTAAGKISVTGLGGKLYCPNPDEFCPQMAAEGYCRRSCSARGTCVNKQCQCTDGWTSFDCSQKGYTDNCARCAGLDPLRTSCYGDTCACNPSNTTCMCQLGLLTGTVCSTTTTVTTTTTNYVDGAAPEGDTRSNTGEELQHHDKSDDSKTGAIIGAIVAGIVIIGFGIFFGIKYGRRLLKAKAAQKAPPVLTKKTSFGNPTLQRKMTSNMAKYAYVP